MHLARLLACSLFVLPTSAGAQAGSAPRAAESAPADAIDRVIEAAMAADGLPGLSLVVGRAGAIVKQAAYGEASLELHVPATLQTVYPIASATKSLASTALFLLVAEGKFSSPTPTTSSPAARPCTSAATACCARARAASPGSCAPRPA